MRRFPVHDRPLLGPSVALIAGVVLAGSAMDPGFRAAALVGACLTGWCCARTPARGWLVLALLACGWVRFEAAACAREVALAAYPRDGSPVETHLEGEVVGPPEATREGGRVLVLRTPLLGVRVHVAPSPPATMRGVDVLGGGDRVRVFGRVHRARGARNGDGADPDRRLRAGGRDLLMSVKSARLVEPLARGGAVGRAPVDALKRVLRRRLDLRVGERGTAREILGAMLLGDRLALDPARKRRFRDAGLAHLLAISGLHVGILAAFALGGLRRLHARPLALVAAGSALLAGLALLVGARPPVLRASGAALAVLAARAVGRDGDAINTLALVAGALVWRDPWLPWSVAFQLSFTAALGILALSPWLRSVLPLPRALGAFAALSLAAYALTSPLTALHFGRVAPVAVLSNLAAVPLVAPLLIAGAALALWSGPGEAVPGVLAIVVEGLARALEGVAAWGSGLEGGAWSVSAPAPLLLAIFAAALARVVAAARGCSIGLLVLALTVVAVHVGRPPAAPGHAEIVVTDVGQGQAVILRGPTGGFVVVDAGGDSGGRFDAGERLVAPVLRRLGGRRLDALLLSHGDSDHAGGARALLRDFEVGELWVGPGYSSRARMLALVDAAVARGTAVVIVERGTRTTRAGLALSVLHPGRGDRDLSSNDRSVVLRVDGPGPAVLLPGDLERNGEGRMLSRGDDVSAAVLVLAHHGARDATGEAWLEVVSPRLALVSAGRHNRFGHPHGETLARLGRRGIPVLRTDQSGMLRLRRTADRWHLVELGAASRRHRATAPE